jgi:hypothetical protein
MRSLVGYTAPLIIITFPKGGARGASPKGTEEQNMTMTTTEILGVIVRVLELFSQERNALIKGGLDVDGLAATLNLLLEESKAADAAQESLKRQLRSSTSIAELKLRRAYINASGMLDMAIAVVDKTSPAAKNFQSIRSRVRKSPEEEQIVPVPVPNPIGSK